jgi:hypothetical protein
MGDETRTCRLSVSVCVRGISRDRGREWAWGWEEERAEKETERGRTTNMGSGRSGGRMIGFGTMTAMRRGRV